MKKVVKSVVSFALTICICMVSTVYINSCNDKPSASKVNIENLDSTLNDTIIPFCTVIGDEMRSESLLNYWIAPFAEIMHIPDSTTSSLVDSIEQHYNIVASVADSLFLWPFDSVLVYFYDGDDKINDSVIKTASEWSKYCPIEFIRTWDLDKSHIRITTRMGGYASMIGSNANTRQYRSQPTMWLQSVSSKFLKNYKEYKQLVLHEFGHALGLIHEHQHPGVGINWDTAVLFRYYDSLYKMDRASVKKNVIEKFKSSHGIYGRWDPNSIMIYAIPPALCNRQFDIKWPNSLSAEDKKFIAKIYNR